MNELEDAKGRVENQENVACNINVFWPNFQRRDDARMVPKATKAMNEKDLKRKKKVGRTGTKENEDLVSGTNSVKDFCLSETPKGAKLR